MEIMMLRNELKYSRLLSDELKTEQIKDAADAAVLAAKTLYQKVCQKHNEVPDDIDVISVIHNTEATVMYDDITNENVSIALTHCQKVMQDDIERMCDLNDHEERTNRYEWLLLDIKYAYDCKRQLHGENVIRQMR